MNKILAKKVNMTQLFDAEGNVIPVTVLRLDGPLEVEAGTIVDVSGLSKGKGFQGVVKRHGFHGGSRTHGQKHSEREPGSIGATWPQRVLKVKRMPGRMFVKTATIKNLQIVRLDKEKNLLYVKGAIPGSRGGLIKIRSKA